MPASTSSASGEHGGGAWPSLEAGARLGGYFSVGPLRMNAMVGGAYFKAVCSSEDETLLFPSSTDHTFCQQVALCMAEKHPSKR